MYMDFGEFFSSLFSARLSFSDIGAALAEAYRAAISSGGVAPLTKAIGSLFGEGAVLMPMLLFLFSLFVCICGARLFPLFRFSAAFILGCVVGACYFAPPFAALAHSAPTLFIAIGSGILVAAISRSLWLIAYPSAFALACYVLVGNTLGWGIALAVIAAVTAALLALVVRKSAEIVITSVFGAWGICECVRMLWDFTADFKNPHLALLVATLTVGFFGALVQFRAKERM